MACDYIIQCVDVRSLKNDFQGARIYHTVNPDCCCKGQMMTLKMLILSAAALSYLFGFVMFPAALSSDRGVM